MVNVNPAPELLEQVARLGLFRGLSDAELKAVAQVDRHRQVVRGHLFFHQGDPGDALYVLIHGQVRLSQVSPEGHQVILRFVTPGEMFGGIAALGDTIYPASAEAVEDSSAMLWDSATITRLIERYPRIALNALEILVKRMQEMQDRYRELATERVERRVARMLLRLASQTGRQVEGGVLIDLPLSRQDLAEMTGTTLYTVSRIVSQWEQKGFVESGREQVLIKFPHALVAIAEDLPPRAPASHKPNP